MNQIDELRQIIVGNEADLLDELKQRIENVEKRATDVAEVLPQAIDERLKADNRLVDSFKQPVSLGLQQAIRDEPDKYAEILYPVMAPSIRRAISQAIGSMMVTINQTIGSATSAEGLALRIESFRTGVPYAELMLRNSASFTVEHIYLMDYETGLLIEEAHNPNADSLDGDAVSAMFSAIQSFVQDSFSHDKATMLTDFKSEQQSARHNTWILHGSKMRLACVILGDAPESLREKLYDLLDRVHVDFASQCAEFDGDTSGFSGVSDYLEPVLHESGNDSRPAGSAKPKKKTPILPLLIIGLLIGLIAFYFFSRHSQLVTVEHFLRQTPGVALTDLYWDGGGIVAEGLQDPDAVVPYLKLQQEGVDPETLIMKTVPFRSLEFSMELQRFKLEFDLPSGVEFGVEDDIVSLYGESSIDWLLKNDIRIRQLSADNRLDISKLSASPQSVMDMLRTQFRESDFSSVTTNTIFSGDHVVIELGGSIPDEVLYIIKATFVQSYWVDVSAN